MIDLIYKPCKGANVTAAEALENRSDRDKTKACDGVEGEGPDDDFYHSAANIPYPYITLDLRESYLVETITVVNVHTGAYCANTPIKCIMRLDGAMVEVLKGKFHLSVV